MKVFEILKPNATVDTTPVTESVTLTESSKYTKLRQYIHNLKPQGAGILIATPMYPEGGSDLAKEYEAMSDSEKQEFRAKNNERYEQGETFIRDVLKKRYFKQKGMFGLPEKSYIVIDVDSKEAVAIGRKWKQTAVIHVSVEELKGGKNRLVFRLINTVLSETGELESFVSSFTNAGADAEDYYSQIGRQKWVIPFYDSEEEWLAAHGSLDGAPRRKSGKDAGKVLFRRKDGRLMPPKKLAA